MTLPPAALDLTTQRGPQSSSARWLNIDVSRTSIERTPVKLNVSLRSNVISAVIAGVIYLIIYLATGGGVAGAIIGAVILAVIVFLIAFAFSRLIAPRLR